VKTPHSEGMVENSPAFRTSLSRAWERGSVSRSTLEHRDIVRSFEGLALSGAVAGHSPNGTGLCVFIPEGWSRIARRFNAGTWRQRASSPEGTAEKCRWVSRPCGTYQSQTSTPALKRRAILDHPSGTETGPTILNPGDIGSKIHGPVRAALCLLRSTHTTIRRLEPS
jgi:hypothetical protein